MTVGLPTKPGGRSTARSRPSPPAGFSRREDPKASRASKGFRFRLNVNPYGCDPACVSVVPSALLNHPSRPWNPNDAGTGLIAIGVDVLAGEDAPPPATVTPL